jgi:hypothetical protein
MIGGWSDSGSALKLWDAIRLWGCLLHTAACWENVLLPCNQEVSLVNTQSQTTSLSLFAPDLFTWRLNKQITLQLAVRPLSLRRLHMLSPIYVTQPKLFFQHFWCYFCGLPLFSGCCPTCLQHAVDAQLDVLTTFFRQHISINRNTNTVMLTISFFH